MKIMSTSTGILYSADPKNDVGPLCERSPVKSIAEWFLKFVWQVIKKSKLGIDERLHLQFLKCKVMYGICMKQFLEYMDDEIYCFKGMTLLNMGWVNEWRPRMSMCNRCNPNP